MSGQEANLDEKFELLLLFKRSLPTFSKSSLNTGQKILGLPFNVSSFQCGKVGLEVSEGKPDIHLVLVIFGVWSEWSNF